MQETARSRRRKAAAPHQPGAAFASFVLTRRYGGRGLRFIRADPPLHAGQPSPLRRARLPPPGLPTRRGPHWAALTAAARPPYPRKPLQGTTRRPRRARAARPPRPPRGAGARPEGPGRGAAGFRTLHPPAKTITKGETP